MARCDCIKKDEERLKKYFLENENAESVEGVSFENEAFMMSGGTQLYSPVVIKYTERNKKGELKSKKKKVNMTYNYCPLCGKAYYEPKEDKLIEVSELEYIRLQERAESNYKAYVSVYEELSTLKHCQYCWHTASGQDWSDNGVCRKCCHTGNFKPILAETVVLSDED